MIGRNLRALICGSAPLSVETQLFFMMLGIPVLQSYGLTETTAICTLDDPRHYEAGTRGARHPRHRNEARRKTKRFIVRGPNIFPGYWNRPQETAKALRDGWFHTGDQGEVDASGNWRIIGRIKNLIILGSGHNIAPEPIEEETGQHLARRAQACWSATAAAIFRPSLPEAVTAGNRHKAAIDAVNPQFPHYKQIRALFMCDRNRSPSKMVCSPRTGS